jgi:hypothetical protein
MINLLKTTNKTQFSRLPYARRAADQSYAIISGFMNITAIGWICSILPPRIAVSASILRGEFSPAPLRSRRT